MIKNIVLSMESEPIYKMLEPGDIFILYKEEGSYVYAINKDGSLAIERALVPPIYTKRVKDPVHVDYHRVSVSNCNHECDFMSDLLRESRDNKPLKNHQPNVDQTQHAGSPDQKDTQPDAGRYL